MGTVDTHISSAGRADDKYDGLSLGQVGDRICATHHARLQQDLCELRGQLDHSYQHLAAQLPELAHARRLFATFDVDLRTHMLAEEEVLYGLCHEDRVPSSVECREFSDTLDRLGREHAYLEEQLVEMLGLLESRGDNPICRVLSEQLLQFRVDFVAHINEEDTVLVPRLTERLERLANP